METIVLLGIICGIALFTGLIYLIFALCFLKKKTKTKTEIVRDYVKQKCGKGCTLCAGGCDDTLGAIERGEASLNDCKLLSASEKEDLNNVLDAGVSSSSGNVAFVFCRGGTSAKQNYNYCGTAKCSYVNNLYEGPKVCKSACIGCMDCAKVCPTGAIKRTEKGVAEVDRSLCIGCGECVKVCPDEIIRMIPSDQEVVVACSLYKKYLGGDPNDICKVACTKCGECAKACPYGAIRNTNRGVFIDPYKCKKCFNCVYVCPNGTITRLLTDLKESDKN